MITIKRVGLNSAFKVGAIVGLILSIVTGLLFVGLQSVFVSAMVGVASIASGSDQVIAGSTNQDMLDALTAFGVVGLCIFYVTYIVFSTISGGIAGLLWAFAYNLAARWVGGLEVELEGEPGKRKRDTDDIFE